MPQSQYPLLIRRLLLTANRVPSDSEIVYEGHRRYTYGAFIERIHRMASALSALGVSKGKTVGVLDWDSHRFLELFFAVPRLGATLHTVNIRLSPRQILTTIDHAQDDVLLVHESFLDLVRDMPFASTPRCVLLTDGDTLPPNDPMWHGEYESLIAQASSQDAHEEFDEDVRATLFYTTGTTGEPKGVWFSHRQIVLHTMGLGLATSGMTAGSSFTVNDVYMPLTNMFHVHAWGFPYLATMLGVKQVYPGQFDIEKALRLIDQEGVTFTHCVPSVLHMLLEHPAADCIDLSRLKINTGGMALPRGLAEKAIDRGIGIFHGYGLSESCPVLTLATLAPHMKTWEKSQQLDVLTRTGRPLPLVDLQIQDETGQQTLSDGRSTGEITARAPWLTQGYLDDHEGSKFLWRSGRLHTGDRAYFDDRGFVQITDRLSDAIKTGGEWVSSIQLESLISKHPKVSEVAVIGVPHEKWGERPVAVIVPEQDIQRGNPDPEFKTELRLFLENFVRDGVLPKWALPEAFFSVDHIPKTSVGKLDKSALRTRFQTTLIHPVGEKPEPMTPT